MPDLNQNSQNHTGNFYPSTLGFKYPLLRDHHLQSGEQWLISKKFEDDAEGLWRIHDSLYNLTEFIYRHPGGSDWLVLTKGTDITELFESHHLSEEPDKMLNKFFVRKATTKRNSPFTFKDDGFYRTLKRNIRGCLKDVPTWPLIRSQLITDIFLLVYLLFMVFAMYLNSFVFGVAAGIVLSCTIICAHNFCHQRDNFRMYYFDLSLMSSRSWRVSHIMSHHMYPNTIRDFEISAFEPYLQYLPQKKNIFTKYLSWLYFPVLCGGIFIRSWLTELTYNFQSGQGFSKSQLLPFIAPILMHFITGHPITDTIQIYVFIIITASIHFGFVGLNAAHHHPDIFHDGDTPRPKEELDWGIYQLDAVRDRKGFNKSQVLVLTSFGNHSLHHLFPTLDHGILKNLYPIVKNTCKDFGIELKKTSQFDLIYGQFKQLAKIRPKLESPKLTKFK